MNDTSTSATEAATQLATILNDLEAAALEGCTLETVVLSGTYTDGRGGYAGNLRRSLTPDALRALLAGGEELRRFQERTEVAESAAAGLRDALNRERADTKRLERLIAEQYTLLEQAKLAPGPTGLTRAWSGYDDDEFWFPTFANLADAKAYAEAAFRAQCAALETDDPGEITWKERAARTDATGYPGMFDLQSDIGGDGWVVCEVLVHPNLASGLREHPIVTDEPEPEPVEEYPGQGVLPVETAGSAK